MSRPRSRSPHYRRFPWEESSFDPHKVPTEPGGNPQDRSRRPRPSPEDHWRYAREDLYQEDQRRSPSFPDDRQPGHQRGPDEGTSYHRTPSPRYDAAGLNDRRLSPPRGLGGDGDGRREGFQEYLQSYENRGRLPQSSPPKVARERLPQTPRSHDDHQQREPGTSWREEQGRGEGRFRGLSPPAREEDQRGGAGRGGRGRRSEQGPNRGRRREGPLQERSPSFKRQRRDVDDTEHLGFRDEEDFGGQRYSVDSPRDTQGGVARGDTRPVRPLVIEHDHGIAEGRKRPQWEQRAVDRRDLDGGPRPPGSPQERFRTPLGRTEDRDDARGGRHLQDHWRDSSYVESERSPAPQERQNAARYGNRDGPMNHKGRGGPRPMNHRASGGPPGPVRGRLNRGQGGRTKPLMSQPRSQQPPQGYQGPHEEQRPGHRPFRGACFEDPVKGAGANWAGEKRLPQWDHDRPRSLERRPPRDDLDPKMPRQRQRGWNEKKNNAADATALKEETLTIKVDMTRPVNRNSSPCYSSDRQLSSDLVNVGRQRLDFLPMLEHSGLYQESATRSGTFAQEIITLVHHVKEHYFRDAGLTLNERFSAPPRGRASEDEGVELTLNERFSSSRGFSLNTGSLLDGEEEEDEDEEEEPLFSRLGSTQGLNQLPVRGPGDLRHDLERRRQERLEGVKVTIAGKGASQRPPAPVSESCFPFSDEADQAEDESVSSWTDEQGGRRDDNMVQSRGALFSDTRRQNNHFYNNNNRVGAMRRKNSGGSSIDPTGPDW